MHSLFLFLNTSLGRTQSWSMDKSCWLSIIVELTNNNLSKITSLIGEKYHFHKLLTLQKEIKKDPETKLNVL